MSSFIGHGLAALTAKLSVPLDQQPFSKGSKGGLWLGWLILIAWAPDIDYIVPALAMGQNQGARITHSITISLLLPALTMMALWVMGLRQQKFWVGTGQAIATGLSHPVMDWLVGVLGLPLFWPLNSTLIKAPVGLLPSAGKPHWQNYYFYANLAIELGILVPLILLGLGHLPWQKPKLKFWQTAILVAIMVYCLRTSMVLSR